LTIALQNYKNQLFMNGHHISWGAILNSNTRPVIKGLILFLSSGTYLGYFPFASGTFGTLWGIPLAYWLSGEALWIQGIIILGAVGLAIYVAGEAEKIWLRKDPSRVVIDEIVGYLVAMIGLPFSWATALLGFLIFRVMDILKPYPIRKIDQSMPGGWGIVLDDVLAGVYTHFLLRLWLHFASP
jgi:phosphatidylglycerophosphatase A